MVQRVAASIVSGKQLQRLCRRILVGDACGWLSLVQNVDVAAVPAAFPDGSWYSNGTGSLWGHDMSVRDSSELGHADSRGAEVPFNHSSDLLNRWKRVGATVDGRDLVKDDAGKYRAAQEARSAREQRGFGVLYGKSIGGCVKSGYHVLSPSIRTLAGRAPLQLQFQDFAQSRVFSSDAVESSKDQIPVPDSHMHSQRAVVTALWCNLLVFSLKIGVWMYTASHVMLAEAVHSLADFANQGLLAYGLVSSRRAPDALHPYGYQKERFVWSLISAVGIFCLGSGATIVHGIQHLWDAQPLEHVGIAAAVIGGSVVMEGASLLVALSAVRKGAAAEGMTVKEYLWRGHDPTSVAVLMEDGAAVTGLAIAAVTLAAVQATGNPIWDPIGSIVVGNLLGVVAIFLIQRNRQALIGRSIEDKDMKRIMKMLSSHSVVDAVYDCKSEVIGPGQYRFKAEIDFNGVQIVQNYLERTGRAAWIREFTAAVNDPRDGAMDIVMANYGEEVVSAIGSEIDRLEKEIQLLVPGIRHVDIEVHNPKGPTPREKFYTNFMDEFGK